jgi:hypothetical protein
MKFVVALSSIILAASTTASALELSAASYETETAGKTVFLKFFVPG